MLAALSSSHYVNGVCVCASVFYFLASALLVGIHAFFFSTRGDMHPALWGAKMGNSWRTTTDIGDTWERYKICTLFFKFFGASVACIEIIGSFHMLGLDSIHYIIIVHVLHSLMKILVSSHVKERVKELNQKQL